MKIKKFISFLLFLCCFAGCKSGKDKPACIYRKTDKTISTTYPFDKSDRIGIVSYESRNEADNELIKNDSFRVAGIGERIVLNKVQIDTLFSLLYDYQRNKNRGSVSQADCYNPRHAVVFYKANKAIAFWEICLECGGQRQSTNTDFEKFCDENICRVQHFFINAGIKEGIIPEMCTSKK